MSTRPVLLVLAVCATTRASADPTDSGTDEATLRGAPAHYIDLRAGFASSALDRPTLCMEVHSPWQASVESCGTASGLLHEQKRDLVHLRMNIPVMGRGVWGGWGALRGGLGIAKLEAGLDQPGFPFRDPDPVTRGSVAGPDAAISVQWMRPAGRGFEWMATGTVGLAWFAGADRLIVPQDHFQPYVSIDVGAGW